MPDWLLDGGLGARSAILECDRKFTHGATIFGGRTVPLLATVNAQFIGKKNHL